MLFWFLEFPDQCFPGSGSSSRFQFRFRFFIREPELGSYRFRFQFHRFRDWNRFQLVPVPLLTDFFFIFQKNPRNFSRAENCIFFINLWTVMDKYNLKKGFLMAFEKIFRKNTVFWWIFTNKINYFWNRFRFHRFHHWESVPFGSLIRNRNWNRESEPEPGKHWLVVTCLK